MCTTYSRPPCRRKLEHALPLDINNRWRSLSDSDMFMGNGRAVFGILCFREGPPRDESDRRATDVQLSLLPRWFLLAPLDCVLVIIFPLAISFKVCSSPSQASDAWPCLAQSDLRGWTLWWPCKFLLKSIPLLTKKGPFNEEISRMFAKSSATCVAWLLHSVWNHGVWCMKRVTRVKRRDWKCCIYRLVVKCILVPKMLSFSRCSKQT